MRRIFTGRGSIRALLLDIAATLCGALGLYALMVFALLLGAP